MAIKLKLLCILFLLLGKYNANTYLSVNLFQFILILGTNSILNQNFIPGGDIQ